MGPPGDRPSLAVGPYRSRTRDAVYPLPPTAPRPRPAPSVEVHARMVKRARGSVRPGQRRPIDRRPATPAAASAASVTPKPSGLSDAELARAAELEAQLLAEERAAETARKRTAERAPTREMAPGRAMAMEDEYAYVARDVKDIIRIAVILLAILFALYLIIDVFDVVKIG